MYISGSTSTNTNHQKDQVQSIPNFPIDADLLRELNARYLHDMNTTRINGFSTFLRAKPDQNSNILSPSNNSLKSNKWCTAHIRVSWMIYHKQHCSKDETQPTLLNNKLPDLISNTKSIVPPSSNNSLNQRSPLGSLGSLFPFDTNGLVHPLNFDWSRFARSIGSVSSINDSNNESRKRSSSVLDNDHHPASHHSFRKHNIKPKPTLDPLTLSIIERQRLQFAYASLFPSTSQINHCFSTNLLSTLFHNNQQRDHFLNSLRLAQHGIQTPPSKEIKPKSTISPSPLKKTKLSFSTSARTVSNEEPTPTIL